MHLINKQLYTVSKRTKVKNIKAHIKLSKSLKVSELAKVRTRRQPAFIRITIIGSELVLDDLGSIIHTYRELNW